MHRIDHATAAPGELFTEGNPSAPPTPATTVTADWLNDMQENLAQLVEAASIALVKGDGTQVTDAIQALIAAAFAGYATPPQFDNDTSIATTAFVQRALGNMSAHRSISTNTTLTATDFGKLILLGATMLTITLPAANSAPSGSSIRIQYAVAGTGASTIQRAGADVIETGGGGSLSSVTLLGGDSLEFVTNGAGWFLMGGVGQAKYSKSFDSSLATNGYQKLPSGLIIQWGNSSATSAGNVITLPVAFPSLCAAVHLTVNNTSAAAVTLAATQTLSQITAYSTNTVGIRWIAVGY